MESDLLENEILCTAQRVKYHHIEYHDGYVTIEQNRTRRRVPDGYHFEDDGQYIAVSTVYSQHKATIRHFVLNKETKEWRDWQTYTIERHTPEKKEAKESNVINDLKR